MSLIKLVEESIDQKKILNEATEYEISKEIFELYSVLFENLSDAMYDSANKANLDGNGKVSEDLRKAEVAIQKIKQKLKTVTGSKSKEKLEAPIKKILGEMGNSLKAIKNRVDEQIIPTFDIEKAPEDETGDLEFGDKE